MIYLQLLLKEIKQRKINKILVFLLLIHPSIYLEQRHLHYHLNQLQNNGLYTFFIVLCLLYYREEAKFELPPDFTVPEQPPLEDELEELERKIENELANNLT